MYEKILDHWKRQMPDFPEKVDLELGLAIKQIRLRMGLTQDELARDSKIKPAALKTLENGYAKTTTLNNIHAIAEVLRVPIQEVLSEAREWFPGNFFVQKLNRPSIEGRRKKRREDIWYKLKNIQFEGFKFEPFSPPLISGSHFCFSKIEIDPGKTIKGLRLPHPNQIAGFVSRGSLKINYNGKKEITIFGNQGFSLRGDKIHDFSNTDSENPVIIYLVFSLFPTIKSTRYGKNAKEAPISVGRGVAAVREIFSDATDRALSYAELSYRTGIDEKSLKYLEQTVSSDQAIYWDKIETICHSFQLPFEHFLDLARCEDNGYVQVATAHDRAFIDYRHYLGVRIKSALFPSPVNRFHISEMYIDPRTGVRKVEWKRKDHSMICVYVESGELRIEMGKNRKVLLSMGESVYFDGSLGYIFTNPGTNPAKILIATHPGIIF